MILPNSAQKQIFMTKIFVVKLPATDCSCYKVIENFVGENFRSHAQTHEIFNLKNFGLYGIKN